MKQNNTDRIIKEQLDSLNEAPGISFNKEQTWDKLEHRLERVTAKKNKAIYYWFAAAASLILLVFLLIGNKASEKSIVKKTKTTHQKTQNEQPETKTQVFIPTSALAAKNKKEKIKHASLVSQQKKEILNIQPEVLTTFEINDEHPDINKGSKPDSVVKMAPNIPLAAKPKMKVVHINDLVNEEYHTDMIPQENTFVLKSLHFFKPANTYEITYSRRDEEYVEHYSFKIKLN